MERWILPIFSLALTLAAARGLLLAWRDGGAQDARRADPLLYAGFLALAVVVAGFMGWQVLHH
ncbi:hypothetical protein GTZ99_01890 [Novosphingobium sp. FSY-8]|uniref:Uncharacterized protein n=1 Tax=Novosphingobium ovatum TaxID=1908523 RepID=A0ABW9X9U5_9SPHN|nr:hypothetical protein [Novosphingobium ovatum]NBC35306.1 hypothetical protein [Novosphingobium ovatum]